jgi:transposase
MLAELVELVIGVDTHADTHTAAVLATDTGAVLATARVNADEDGYRELVALAEAHGGLRGWAIEGTGGYGVGLTPTQRQRTARSNAPDSRKWM